MRSGLLQRAMVKSRFPFKNMKIIYSVDQRSTANGAHQLWKFLSIGMGPGDGTSLIEDYCVFPFPTLMQATKRGFGTGREIRLLLLQTRLPKVEKVRDGIIEHLSRHRTKICHLECRNFDLVCSRNQIPSTAQKTLKKEWWTNEGWDGKGNGSRARALGIYRLFKLGWPSRSGNRIASDPGPPGRLPIWVSRQTVTLNNEPCKHHP